MDESPHGLFPCPRTLRRDSEELSGATAPPPRSGDIVACVSANLPRPNHNLLRIPRQGGEEPPAPDGAPPRSEGLQPRSGVARQRERKHKPERKRQRREINSSPFVPAPASSASGYCSCHKLKSRLSPGSERMLPGTRSDSENMMPESTQFSSWSAAFPPRPCGTTRPAKRKRRPAVIPNFAFQQTEAGLTPLG